MEFTCAIVAGGGSRRMGRDKATLEFQGKMLIQWVYDEAKKIFDHIIIVSSRHDCFETLEVPVVRDVLPVSATIVGVVSGLIHAPSPYVVVLPCDTPFVSAEALEYMIGESRGQDIIVPRTIKGYEPLHAIYNRSCISYMLSNIERNKLSMLDLFPYLSVRELNDHPVFYNRGVSVFTNINVEADLDLEGFPVHPNPTEGEWHEGQRLLEPDH
jgi:molybdopterin-guanine dinucleotide biosynthesis protein A